MKIPDFETEPALLKQGFSVIGGVDEVGRGQWWLPALFSISKVLTLNG